MWGTRWGAVALAVVLAAACSGASDDDEAGADGESDPGGDEAAVEAELYEGDDFYREPSPLPDGEHGTLIRYEEVTGADAEGGTTWRIMYLSEDVAGDPIAVTGTAVVPETDAPEGGRPILTVAHGTTGIADECAPSKNPGAAGVAALAGGGDYLVATSDYEGLGTEGRHPYLVGESEGRGVLDAARAAAELPGADAGDQLASSATRRAGTAPSGPASWPRSGPPSTSWWAPWRGRPPPSCRSSSRPAGRGRSPGSST